MPRAHVLVVDDDARIRRALLQKFRRATATVSVARDARQGAGRCLEGLEFDILVLE